VLAAVAFVLVTLHLRSDSQASSVIRPSGIPPSISTPLAGLMALAPVTNAHAPNFALTDQRGATVTMSGLKGKVVVLEFFDPHCTDVCPIVSQELVDANKDLGLARSDVVFAAVNVNPYHVGIADMESFSSEHSLTSIASWHFLTGTVPALEATWKAYGVDVNAPSPTADVQHSDYVYFIDRQGRLRYMADPNVDHRANGDSYLPSDQLAAWGNGIALVSKSLIG
jgi:cytochrome oxidase Cu insertion factor (SCO1/SenC/PrrC family)